MSQREGELAGLHFKKAGPQVNTLEVPSCFSTYPLIMFPILLPPHTTQNSFKGTKALIY